jgi:hypothetical protein
MQKYIDTLIASYGELGISAEKAKEQVYKSLVDTDALGGTTN